CRSASWQRASIHGALRLRSADAFAAVIPALVLDLDDTGARVVSLMENMQRDDLNEVERAEGLLALKALTGSTWEEIGQLLGITKRHVLHLVSLTRLPQPVQDLIRDGSLSAKHGRLIAYVHDARLQEALASVAADLRLTAQQTAETVKRVASEPGFTAADTAWIPASELRQRVAHLAAQVSGRAQPPHTLYQSDRENLTAVLRETLAHLDAIDPDGIPAHARPSLCQALEALRDAAERLRRTLTTPADPH
ncbi:MAG: ParB/RepB/Spo0J family partition protein, partial [Armatimonadota bacterium]|nr:ParB/RepB/Spo0J family partition protein [Armatimonadota bacterium]